MTISKEEMARVWRKEAGDDIRALISFFAQHSAEKFSIGEESYRKVQSHLVEALWALGEE